MNNLYSNFLDALNACSAEGYNNPNLVKMVIEKNLIFRDQVLNSQIPILDLNSARTILGVSLAITDNRLTVLDFGGGGGYHYFIARAAIPMRIALDWMVIETPSMVRLAKSKLSTDELNFYDDINFASRGKDIDLIFASGSLQYCPDVFQTLDALMSIRARHLFITRTPLSSDHKFIAIQKSRLKDNGPGPMPSGFNDCEITYPITISCKSEIERALRKKYSIRFSLKEEGGHFSINDKVIDSQYGFFCDLLP